MGVQGKLSQGKEGKWTCGIHCQISQLVGYIVGFLNLWDTLSDFSKVGHTVDIFSIIQKDAIVQKSRH